LKKAATGPTQRQLRVAEEIRHVLSGIFGRGEFRDPDLATAQITVTEVRIGPDLKRATAFISRLGEALLPGPGTVLQEGDVLHVMAEEHDLDRIATAFAKPAPPGKGSH